MKRIFSSAAAAALLLGGGMTVAAAPAAAQQVKGIGVINLNAVVANSNAFRTAQTQRQTAYAAQINQANSRRQQIAAQLQPLYTKFEADRRAATPNQTALQQQVTQIQQIEANGQRELQTILQPVALSEAYVTEQITSRLQAAVEAAAKKRGVSMVVSPEAVVWADNSYNMTQAVTDELNRLVPSVSVTPPAGWQPREIREAQAAQAAQAGQRPATPAPTTPAPAQQPRSR